ncbi:MAG: ferrous iron transport protein A [Pantanalinema sp. GBBB05]|nr:ferrous iron transport protein A [Pantanalinema sp. GBBB05]
MMMLSTVKPGTIATVAALATNNDAIVKKLLAMGIYPGVEIELERRFPSYVIKIGRSRAAFDQQIAHYIYLRPCDC